MVVIESIKCSEEAPVNCEIMMDSGNRIFYVAPYKYSSLEREVVKCDGVLQRKNSGNGPDDLDKWEGVSDLCQVLDNAIEIENEVDLFEGKRVLELGFCTALPSVFAVANGAHSVALHCLDRKALNTAVRATLRRNNVLRSRVKTSSGDYEACRRQLAGQHFDVILAPELIHTDEADFDAIHEVLDAALAPNGIILFSARTHYLDCSGSLPAFLDLVKLRGRFDAQTRWTSDRSEVAPRRVIQMTRSIR